LDNVFPLNFLIKCSESCSLGEVVPSCSLGELNPFVPWEVAPLVNLVPFFPREIAPWGNLVSFSSREHGWGYHFVSSLGKVHLSSEHLA